MLVMLNPWVRACATEFPALFSDLGFPPFFRVFSDMTLPVGLIDKKMDVVEWSRALDLRLSDWCCSVSNPVEGRTKI